MPVELTSWRSTVLAGLLAAFVLSLPARAQDEDTWQEAEAPPPPAWRMDKLVPIDMPIRSSLVYGIDPATLSIGPDDVLRYVIVAYNPGGSVNAFYEGLRCNGGQVKVYARTSTPGQWHAVTNPEWRDLDLLKAATRHSLALARQGACDGPAVGARTPEGIIRRLQTGAKRSDF